MELIEKEIAEGANINSQNGRDGETPLQRAATRGQIEAAELLLSKGADVNIGRKRDGQKALDLVADKGHEELTELLKKNGGRSSLDRSDQVRPKTWRKRSTCLKALNGNTMTAVGI